MKRFRRGSARVQRRVQEGFRPAYGAIILSFGK
jgi:hypothetical protein